MNPLAAYITITLNLAITAVCVWQFIISRAALASAGEARSDETRSEEPADE